MTKVKYILLILLFHVSVLGRTQLKETIWNFPANFLQNAEIGNVLKLRDGTYSCGVELKKDGRFTRISQIIYYENQRVNRRPDSAHGEWKLESIGDKQFLNLTYSKQNQLKFEIIELRPNWLELKVIAKT